MVLSFTGDGNRGKGGPRRELVIALGIWLGAVVLAWLASAIILYYASNLRKLLGDRGLTAVERLMGMLLVIVAVEMLMKGVAEYLRGAAP
jgi:multiple antibiotic resistance protein